MEIFGGNINIDTGQSPANLAALAASTNKARTALTALNRTLDAFNQRESALNKLDKFFSSGAQAENNFKGMLNTVNALNTALKDLNPNLNATVQGLKAVPNKTIKTATATGATKGKTSEDAAIKRTQSAYNLVSKALQELNVVKEKYNATTGKTIKTYSILNSAGEKWSHTVTTLKGKVVGYTKTVDAASAAYVRQTQALTRAQTEYAKIAGAIANLQPTSSRLDTSTGKLIQTYVTFDATGRKTTRTLTSLDGVIQKVTASEVGLSAAQERKAAANQRAEATYARIAGSLTRANLVSERYNSSTDKLVQTYRALDSSGKAVAYTVTRVGNQLVNVSSQTKTADKASGSLLLSWGSIARIFAGQVMWRGVSLLRNQITEAARSSFELRNSIAAIQTISQSAQQTTRVWTQDIANISKLTGAGLVDVSEGLYTITSNQIAQGKAAVVVAEEATKAALVMRSTTQDAVKIGAAILNSYNMTVAQLPEIYAKVFKSIELGRFLASDIAQDIGIITVPAAQLGIKLEELLASYAGITIQGIDASKAMTAMRNMLNALLKPSDEMKKLFDELGVSSGDAAIKLYTWTGLLKQIEQRTKGSNTELAQLFQNIRGYGGAVAQVGRGLDIVTAATVKIADATETYNKALGIMMEEPTTRLAKMQAAFTAEAVKIGVEWIESIADATSGYEEIIVRTSEILRLTGLLATGTYEVTKEVLKYANFLQYAGLDVLKYLTQAAVDQAALTKEIQATTDAWAKQALKVGELPSAMKEYEDAGDKAFRKYLAYNTQIVASLNEQKTKYENIIKVKRQALSDADTTFGKGIAQTVSLVEGAIGKLQSAMQTIEGRINNIKFDRFQLEIERSLEGADLTKQRAILTEMVEGIKSQLRDAPVDIQDALLQNLDFTTGKLDDITKALDGNLDKLQEVRTKLAEAEQGKSVDSKVKAERELKKIAEERARALGLQARWIREAEQLNRGNKNREGQLLDANKEKLRLAANKELQKIAENIRRLDAAKAKAEQKVADAQLTKEEKVEDLKAKELELTKERGAAEESIFASTEQRENTAITYLKFYNKLLEDRRQKELELLDLQQEALALQIRHQTILEQQRTLELGPQGDPAAFEALASDIIRNRVDWAEGALDVARRAGTSEAAMARLATTYTKAATATGDYVMAQVKLARVAEERSKNEKAYADATFQYTSVLNRAKETDKARQAAITQVQKSVVDPAQTLISGGLRSGDPMLEQLGRMFENALKVGPDALLTDQPGKLSPVAVLLKKIDDGSISPAGYEDVINQLKALYDLNKATTEASAEAAQALLAETESMNALSAKLPEVALQFAEQKANTEAVSELTRAINALSERIVPTNLAQGGFANYGTDTVPAMLTRGEFVVHKEAAAAFTPLLKAINGGVSRFASGGTVGGVTMGDVNVNMSNTGNATYDAMKIGRELQRLVKQGAITLN